MIENTACKILRTDITNSDIIFTKENDSIKWPVLALLNRLLNDL